MAFLALAQGEDRVELAVKLDPQSPGFPVRSQADLLDQAAEGLSSFCPDVISVEGFLKFGNFLPVEFRNTQMSASRPEPIIRDEIAACRLLTRSGSRCR